MIETVRGIDGCAMASDRGYDLLPTLTPKPPARQEVRDGRKTDGYKTDNYKTCKYKTCKKFD
jgi:hypothetical protein